MSSVMIELADVHKHYQIGRAKPVEVLRGAALNVSAGECVSICGPSGSGKSTLLHIMAGMDRPTRGSVKWKGEEVFAKSRTAVAQWRNRSIGFVFQAHYLMPELSVLENVMLPAMLGRLDRGGEARKLLEHVGLGERLGHLPSELSGGERQRVAIARALVNGPEVVFADEPTGSLDVESAEPVVDLLLDLVAQSKKALVLVTHDEGLALKAQRRLHLHKGQLQAT